MGFEIHSGDCLDVMRGMAPASVDAVVCDPPYGLEFMGKEWDAPWKYGFAEFGLKDSKGRKAAPVFGSKRNPMCRGCHKHQRGSVRHPACKCEAPDFDETPADFSRAYGAWCEAWAREVFRVLKPGGRLLAFGGTRTYHRLTCAIEDAGFIVEDCIMWLYGQGFPKHRSKLKPAYEPIVVARKGGASHLNIDACRIRIEQGDDIFAKNPHTVNQASNQIYGAFRAGSEYTLPDGRWPANVVLDEEAAVALDRMSGLKPTSGQATNGRRRGDGMWGQIPDGYHYGDTGGASRFFYCAKASRAERNAGLEGMPERPRLVANMTTRAEREKGEHRTQAGSVNHHPTVKPLALMRWLVRLVTPEGGLVLDPFCGSGSTGVAAVREGFNFVGIEREPEYVDIARKRIEEALSRLALFESAEKETRQPLITTAALFGTGEADSPLRPGASETEYSTPTAVAQ